MFARATKLLSGGSDDGSSEKKLGSSDEGSVSCPFERNAYCLPEKDWLERRIDVA